MNFVCEMAAITCRIPTSSQEVIMAARVWNLCIVYCSSLRVEDKLGGFTNYGRE